MEPSFHGFVDTPLEAAWLVYLTMKNDIRLFTEPPTDEELESLIVSGSVCVYAVGGVYRELSRDGDAALTAAAANQETTQRAIMEPLIGPHVARDGSKDGGLIKKQISFMVGLQKYIVASYYTIRDGLAGNLPRPQVGDVEVDQAVDSDMDHSTDIETEFSNQSDDGEMAL
ncbi:hypothetical protein VTJ49DRAFT_5779 [Mycothermus thermophilus]|uniref:Uncharacterized protein n=1 Tax=Humicola insolens TaxID=85995 RepID=A0ABR3VQ91_HUMIN